MEQMNQEGTIVSPYFSGHHRPQLTCGVCGEATNSYHFGGIACNGCRSFFRRSVRSKIYEQFICKKDGNCEMTKHERRKCQACRFSRCCEIGMESRLVLGEYDRRVLLANRSFRQNSSQHVPDVGRMYNPSSPRPDDWMTYADHKTAVSFVNMMRKIIQNLPHLLVEQEFGEMFSNVENLTAVSICCGSHVRSLQFSHVIPQFLELTHAADRKALLRRNMNLISTIRVSYGYHPQHLTWPEEGALEANRPVYHFDGYKDKLSPRIWNKYVDIIKKMHLLKMDELCTTLLMITQLFSANCVPLIDAASVEAAQGHYISLLRKYIVWRYGTMDANIVFAKMLSLLTDLSEIKELQNEQNICWGDEELVYFNKKLGDLNPFRDYNIQLRNDEFLGHNEDPYDVLHFQTPTVEMLRGCIAGLATIVQSQTKSEDLETSLMDFLENNLPYVTDDDISSSDDSNQSFDDEILQIF